MSAVVFPTPPPTSNTLTPVQRSHLMRSTKKISRVLGCTPHFMDLVPSSPYLDWSDDEDSYYRPSSRGSIDSSSRSLASPRTRSSSTFSSRPSFSSSLSLRSAKSSSSTSSYDDCWSDSDSTKPPLLRLALASKTRVTRTKGSLSPLSQSTSSDSEEDMRFTLSLPAPQSPRDSIISPTFHIPTKATTRRQKMDRIHRRLGDGFPVELVFPYNDSDDESEDPSPRSSLAVIRVPLPPPVPSKPTPRPQRAHGNGIVNTRDSVISLTTPHRAHRIKRKPVPKLSVEPSMSLPPPPPVPSKDNLQPQLETKKDRLSLILESPLEESPLEHEGMWMSSPVSETLSQVKRRVSRRQSRQGPPSSEWFSEDEDDSTQMLTYAEYMKMIDDLANLTD